MKTIISTDKAPGAIGPYSQAVAAGGFVFTSGQIPPDPATGPVKGDTVEEQSVQVLENLKAVLAEAGVSCADVVKTTCFPADMNDFAAFNAIYARYFPTDCPGRSCVQVARLPKDVKVEVEAIAVRE